MSKELRDSLISIGLFNLIVAGIIFVSMAFFVVGLKYDYTTSSSILFTVVLAFLLLILLIGVLDELRTGELDDPAQAAFLLVFLLVFLLLAMAAVTASLGIFTAIFPQKDTKVFDMVGAFWGFFAWPFVQVGGLLGNLSPALDALFKGVGDFYEGVVKPIEKDSPILSNTISGLLSATLAALLFRGRLAPAARTA